MSEKNRKYENEREKGFEREKELALAELRPLIEGLSEEALNKPFLDVGPETFTLRQILKEIEGSTEYGRLFVQMKTNQRIELAKRWEEIYNESES